MKKKIVAILTGMTLVMSNGILFLPVRVRQEWRVRQLWKMRLLHQNSRILMKKVRRQMCSQMNFRMKKLERYFRIMFRIITRAAKDISIPGADLNEDDLTQNASASGTIVLGVKGSYIADIQAALDRINEIRKEACNEGVQDPRNPSRRLTSSDYVPIKWSSDLEYIARIRAAEASVYIEHTRPNGSSCWTVKSPDGEQSWGEVLGMELEQFHGSGNQSVV